MAQQAGTWFPNQETIPCAGTRGFVRNVVMAKKKKSCSNAGHDSSKLQFLYLCKSIAGSNWKPKWQKYISAFLTEAFTRFFSFPQKCDILSQTRTKINVDRVEISLCGNSDFGPDNPYLARATRHFLAIYCCLYSRCPFQTDMKIFGLCYLGLVSFYNFNT